MFQVRKVKPVLSLWCGEVETERSSGGKPSKTLRVNNINQLEIAKTSDEVLKKNKVSKTFPRRIPVENIREGNISEARRVTTTTIATTTATEPPPPSPPTTTTTNKPTTTTTLTTISSTTGKNIFH